MLSRIKKNYKKNNSIKTKSLKSFKSSNEQVLNEQLSEQVSKEQLSEEVPNEQVLNESSHETLDDNSSKEEDVHTILNKSERLMTFDDILDYYKDNDELNKIDSFDNSDFFNDTSCPTMLFIMNLFNESIFLSSKVLVPCDVRTIFGNILSIFNFEFVNYLIIHKHRKLIFDLKIQNLTNSKSLIELKNISNEISMFLSYEPDFNELDEAIKNKEFIKLEYLKSYIKNDYIEFFNDLLDEGIDIKSLEDFVCCSNTVYYDGSFLMNAKKLLNELFAGYPYKLNPKQKYQLLLNMYRKNIRNAKFEDIKTEIIKEFNDFYNAVFENMSENDVKIILTDEFYDDLSDTLVCYIIQFIKEVSIEALFNNKNTKLRIKNTNMLEVMRGLCPRDEVYTISQINFLRYISYNKSNLNNLLNKKYHFIMKKDIEI